MPTFKWTFRADDAGAVKTMKDFASAVKQAETATTQASSKMSADLDRIADRAKKANASGQNLKGSLSGGIGQSLGQGLESAVSSRSVVAGNVLGQFGGGEALLSGISAKAALAAGGIALAGVAAVKFGADSVQAFSSAAEKVDKFQDVAGGTAKQASLLVGASEQLGVSSDSLAGGMAKLAKNATLNESSLNEYGASVKRTSDGSVDLVATFQSVALAFANQEDPAKRAALGNAAFGRSWASLIDVLERGGSQLDSALESAAKFSPQFNEEDLAKAKNFQIAMVELKQSFTSLQSEVAGPLVEDLTVLAGLLADLTARSKDASGGFAEFAKGAVLGAVAPITALAEMAKKAFNIDTSKATSEVEAFQEMTNRAGQGLSRMGEAARDGFAATHGGAVVGVNALADVADQAFVTASAISTIADSFASAGDAWLNGLGSVSSAAAGILATDDYESALASLDSTFVQAGESQQSFADTSSKSAEQIADAQDAVGKALEGVAEAQVDYQKAVEDAQQRVVDVEESSSKRIVDAQDKVTDARKRAEDQALSSARRVQDATQAVRDASTAALRDDNPYDAARKREDAELDLKRAIEDSGRDQQDAAKGIADAQADLADTERQASKDRAQAQQDAADQITQAQKRIEDANDQVAEANKRLSRTTDEAGAANDRAASKVSAHTVTQAQYDQAVQKTIDATPGYILSLAQRGVPLDEINRKIQGGVDKLRDQGAALGLNTQLVDIYADHAQNATLTVLRMTQATYELYTRLRAAAASVNVDVGIASGEAATLGLNLDVLGRDSGGPLPPGLSLVMNQTGHDEMVMTPAQINTLAGGGGGVVINVQGSIISERDLASIVRNAIRNGNVGFG